MTKAKRISKEVDATETMIERTEDRFGLKPDRLAATVQNLKRLANHTTSPPPQSVMV